jgi:hypothetical protein
MVHTGRIETLLTYDVAESYTILLSNHDNTKL